MRVPRRYGIRLGGKHDARVIRLDVARRARTYDVREAAFVGLIATHIDGARELAVADVKARVLAVDVQPLGGRVDRERVGRGRAGHHLIVLREAIGGAWLPIDVDDDDARALARDHGVGSAGRVRRALVGVLAWPTTTSVPAPASPILCHGPDRHRGARGEQVTHRSERRCVKPFCYVEKATRVRKHILTR